MSKSSLASCSHSNCLPRYTLTWALRIPANVSGPSTADAKPRYRNLNSFSTTPIPEPFLPHTPPLPESAPRRRSHNAKSIRRIPAVSRAPAPGLESQTRRRRKLSRVMMALVCFPHHLTTYALGTHRISSPRGIVNANAHPSPPRWRPCTHLLTPVRRYSIPLLHSPPQTGTG